jgi:hypothetical protein
MKPEELKDGTVYHLTRDVVNPAPDRRQTRHWTSAPVWKAGLRVVCTVWERTELRAAGHYDDLGRFCAGFVALVDALEPAPRNFANVMFGLNRSPATDNGQAVLAELVRQGKITLDNIEAAHTAYSTRPEDEDEAV